jgi:DNA-binding MarR family transcriptional regulator
VLPAFVLKRSFDTGAYRTRYEEPEEKAVPLTAGQAQVLAFLTGRGTASAAHVIAGTGLKRPGVRDALDALAERHLIEPTGETDKRRSPLWRVVARGGAPSGADE